MGTTVAAFSSRQATAASRGLEFQHVARGLAAINDQAIVFADAAAVHGVGHRDGHRSRFL
jgi:hypothetical protein